MEDNFILLENIYTKDSFRPLALLMTLLSLAPDCKPAPILAEHTVWEIQRNGPYSDWHSSFWTRDQGNE